ncbi:hypothetical protein HYH03_006035 [Edaphochlamys debaryana]|uniref:Rab-GAP TBC domain-containing protein n=1 Tax=Edaphochlamys debaryana TaxID=47281 RepID=A0A836C1D7_9CHLO|nr:hypothetical protein HYH03_006035 [Edaphochlamys debaryana]|eukprot:KAG2495792.1 hypothetical protein HYH03_006035 [Edaphochlamys debaryana]
MARALYKDSRLFSTAKGAEVLSRVMFAYLSRNPACGYFRGLAHVAALLLSVFGREREEQAFWALVGLLEKRFFPCSGGQVPLGSRIEVAVLQALLEQRQPALAASLVRLAPDAAEQLCGGWFCTAFVRALPLETALRVWDCCVVEGPKVALRVAMALLKINASSLASCTNLDVLVRVMDGRVSRQTDADALLTVAFKGLGSLSGSSVDAIRARVMASAPYQQRTRSAPLPLGAGAAAVPCPNGSSGGGAVSASGGTSSGGSSRAVSRTTSKAASPWPSPRSAGALLSL